MALQYGTWAGYGGTARIWLALVLLAAAAGVAAAGTWLPLRDRPPARAGRMTVILAVVAWCVAVATFVVCLLAYLRQMRQVLAGHPPATDPITPVTFIAAGLLFGVIVLRGSRGSHALPVTLWGAVTGAMAAPMVFELPFDLIVMARTYPSAPADPALYRALFFLPLFLVEITTLSLLTFSPMVRLSRATLCSLAAMLAVFAFWGLSGFGYPSAPAPIAFNIVSKILAFVTVLTLFVPGRARSAAPGGTPQAGGIPQAGGTCQPGGTAGGQTTPVGPVTR